MAFGFVKKTWKDRISEYPTRRTLTKEDGSTELVTVSRSEGTVSQEGDAFSADNMNDLETRVDNALTEANSNLKIKTLTGIAGSKPTSGNNDVQINLPDGVSSDNIVVVGIAAYLNNQGWMCNAADIPLVLVPEGQNYIIVRTFSATGSAYIGQPVKIYYMINY